MDNQVSMGVRQNIQKKETIMSTSLLYHGFGLRGYRYIRTEYINGHVYFTVEMKPRSDSMLNMQLPSSRTKRNG